MRTAGAGAAGAGATAAAGGIDGSTSGGGAAALDSRVASTEGMAGGKPTCAGRAASCVVAVVATGPLPEQALKARQAAASQGQVRGQRVGLCGMRTATEVKIIGLHSHKKPPQATMCRVVPPDVQGIEISAPGNVPGL